MCYYKLFVCKGFYQLYFCDFFHSINTFSFDICSDWPLLNKKKTNRETKIFSPNMCKKNAIDLLIKWLMWFFFFFNVLLFFVRQDPHFVGVPKSVKELMYQGYIRWQHTSAFVDSSFYNLCLPQLKYLDASHWRFFESRPLLVHGVKNSMWTFFPKSNSNQIVIKFSH